MLVENSKGVIVEVTEEKWEKLMGHGFSSWKVVSKDTVSPSVKKVKPEAIKIEIPKTVTPKVVIKD